MTLAHRTKHYLSNFCLVFRKLLLDLYYMPFKLFSSVFKIFFLSIQIIVSFRSTYVSLYSISFPFIQYIFSLNSNIVSPPFPVRWSLFKVFPPFIRKLCSCSIHRSMFASINSLSTSVHNMFPSVRSIFPSIHNISASIKNIFTSVHIISFSINRISSYVHRYFPLS